MKIRVEEDGGLFIDDVQINDKKAIDSKFLETLFKDSLHQNVQYEIKGTSPYATLFSGIDEITKVDSEFYVKWKTMNESYEKNLKEIEEAKLLISDSKSKI